MLGRAANAKYRVAAAFLSAVTVAACGQTTEVHSCTLKGCGGVSFLSFAAREDGTVAPSGQIRHNNSDSGIREFNCRDAAMASSALPCSDGVLTLMTYGRGDGLEIRFDLQDGSMTEWQQIPLSFTSHTLEDFNGPGCPCTYDTVTAPPIEVPANALQSSQAPVDGGI